MNHPVVALAVKDLKLLLRDKAGFGFTFIFPIVYCIFFGTIFSQSNDDTPSSVRILVADEDQTDASRAFVTRFANTEQIVVEEVVFEKGRELVRQGKRAAVIRLPEGFGAALDDMFRGQPAELELAVDPARNAEAGMLQGLLLQAAFEGVQGMFTDPDAMERRVDRWLAELQEDESVDPVRRGALRFFLPALAGFARQMSNAAEAETPEGGDSAGLPTFEPLVITSVPVVREQKQKQNAYKISFPQGIIWGVMACAAGFGISLVQERTAGTLIRLRTAPMSWWQIVGGKTLACFVTILALMAMLFAIGAIGFDVYPQSVIKLIIAVLCIACCFSGIMLTLSVLGKTEQAAGGISWGILVVMAMVGGGMIPLMVMPDWMKTAGSISPVKWALLAMEGAIWRDFTLAEMLPICLILVAIGAGSAIIGIRLFRWMETG